MSNKILQIFLNNGRGFLFEQLTEAQAAEAQHQLRKAPFIVILYQKQNCFIIRSDSVAGMSWGTVESEAETPQNPSTRMN